MTPPNMVWEYPPYHVEPKDKALGWARKTFDSFMELTTNPDSNVHVIPVIVVSKEPLEPNPGKDFLPHYKEGHEALEEARRLLWATEPTQRKYVDAHHYHAPVINAANYLEWLTKRVVDLGGVVVRRTVQSLDEVLSVMAADVLVNCSGLGSKDLVPDPGVYPCRGELLHVNAPWVKAAVFDDLDNGYVIPCPGAELELGGTADDHTYERRLDPATRDRMLKDNIEMIPSLARGEVGDGWVGLRPCRSGGVRLELEWRQQIPVVHNYGHGGAGMCLSYGCAKEVTQIVAEAGAAHPQLKPNL